VTSAPHGHRGTKKDAAVVDLELPEGHLFDAVGRLVAAGMAARAGLGVDRVDDLQLALQAVRREPCARGTTRILLASDGHELRAEVGPLAGRRHDALEGVLSTLVERVETRTTGADTWITLRVQLPSPARTTAGGKP
jgi:hypothetical protein